MATITTNYGFTLPAVNDPTDEDLWGTEINANFTALDASLKTATDKVHVTLTGNTTLDNTYRNKIILCDATSAAFTVTLQPAATATDGFTITLKKTDSTGNVVTVDGSGVETIDTATTYLLSSQFDSVTISCDGTNWQVASNKTTPTAISDASTAVKGILKLATTAMAIAGTDAATAVTPAALAGIATSSKIVIGALTVQFGKTTLSGTTTTVTFPTSFSGTPYSFMFSLQQASPSPQVYSPILTTLTSSAAGIYQSQGITASYEWIAIGPT